jgi:anti-anti-sigma regulatory factor
MGCTLASVDALARLALALRRAGVELVLVDPPAELRELIDLAGLGETLRVEVRRQPEEREERVGVEEERQLPDPPA